MTDERPRPATGVAKGSLGTGTALDDTQLYEVAEREPPSHGAPAAPPVPAAPARRVASRRVGPGRRLPGPAWIAAAAVVAMVATAIVSGRSGDGPGAGQATSAPAVVAPTAGQSATPSDVVGDGGKGNGKGKGKGNDGGDADED